MFLKEDARVHEYQKNHLHKRVHRHTAAYIFTQEGVKAQYWEHTSEVAQCDEMAHEE